MTGSGVMTMTERETVDHPEWCRLNEPDQR